MRLTLATLALLATLGCGGGGGSSSSTEAPKPVQLDNIIFTAISTKVRINEKIELKIEEINKKAIPFFSIDTDVEVDVNNDGNPANDVDLQGQNKSSAFLSISYSQPGFYTLVLTSTNSKGLLGEKRLDILVKPNDFFTDVQEAIPADFFYVKKSDFDNLIRPYLDIVDQTAVNDLEATIMASLTNGEIIDGFGFKSNDLVVGVNSPNSRFKNDDKDSEREYSGSLDARLVDLGAVNNIYSFLTAKALDNDIIRIASRLYPNSSTITRNSTMTLLNYGDVFCNNTLTYTLNGNQINIGLVLDTTTSPLIQQDKDVISAFNRDFRNKGTYIPISIVVLKEGSLYNTVKAIAAELKHHQDNNP